MVCVFVCYPATEHGNIVLEQRLRELFSMKTEGAAEIWKKTPQWEAAGFVLVTECWWVVNWNTVRKRLQEECTGEIKNTHNISVWNRERKRQFRCSRLRSNIKNNV